MTELKGKVALVTGGSRGQGIARELAEQGAKVYVSNSESPEFIGRTNAALAADPDALRPTGRVLVAAAPTREYGFTDTNGKTPRALTPADV